MGRRKRGGMEAISTLVGRAYPGREPADLVAMRALGWWCRVVPTRIAKNARPVGLKRGVLIVHTSTSAWANSLQYETEAFLAAIHKHAPEAKIKKILFRVGPLPDLPLVPRPKKAPPPPTPLAELPESVARELSRIASDEVRAAVARAVAVGLGRRRHPPDSKGER